MFSGAVRSALGGLVLDHCFKFFGPSEFFNTLSQKQTLVLRQSGFAETLESGFPVVRVHRAQHRRKEGHAEIGLLSPCLAKRGTRVVQPVEAHERAGEVHIWPESAGGMAAGFLAPLHGDLVIAH